MCMMKNSGEKEACEVARNLEALGVRVTNVETRMDKMEASLNDGFKSLSVSISNLGHDVGSRMNIIEMKVVDEKAEWGKTLRKVVLIVTYALVTLACLAAGLNITSRFFPLCKLKQQTKEEKCQKYISLIRPMARTSSNCRAAI